MMIIRKAQPRRPSGADMRAMAMDMVLSVVRQASEDWPSWRANDANRTAAWSQLLRHTWARMGRDLWDEHRRGRIMLEEDVGFVDNVVETYLDDPEGRYVMGVHVGAPGDETPGADAAEMELARFMTRRVVEDAMARPYSGRRGDTWEQNLLQVWRQRRDALMEPWSNAISNLDYLADLVEQMLRNEPDPRADRFPYYLTIEDSDIHNVGVASLEEASSLYRQIRDSLPEDTRMSLGYLWGPNRASLPNSPASGRYMVDGLGRIYGRGSHLLYSPPPTEERTTPGDSGWRPPEGSLPPPGHRPPGEDDDDPDGLKAWEEIFRGGAPTRAVRTASDHGDTLNGQLRDELLRRLTKDVDNFRELAIADKMDGVLPRWRGELRRMILLLPATERLSAMSMFELRRVQDKVDVIREIARVRRNREVLAGRMGLPERRRPPWSGPTTGPARETYETDLCGRLFEEAWEKFPGHNNEQSEQAADWIFDRLVASSPGGLSDDDLYDLYAAILDGLT